MKRTTDCFDRPRLLKVSHTIALYMKRHISWWQVQVRPSLMYTKLIICGNFISVGTRAYWCCHRNGLGTYITEIHSLLKNTCSYWTEGSVDHLGIHSWDLFPDISGRIFYKICKYWTHECLKIHIILPGDSHARFGFGTWNNIWVYGFSIKIRKKGITQGGRITESNCFSRIGIHWHSGIKKTGI